MTASVRAWVGFSALCIGMFMAILDIQIVASALPRIAQALHIPLARLSWIQTAYLITEVIAIALSGRLTRALSTRVLITLGVLGFVAASIGCAASAHFVELIAWRALQGFCGGAIIPTVFSAGFKMFAPALQSRALLLAGAVAMLAPALGPLLGGTIAQTLSWNWLFLINVPVGITVAALTWLLIRIDSADARAWRTFDVPGLLLMALGLTLLQIALKIAPADHWQRPRDFALVIGTITASAAFIVRCVRRRDPLIELAPLRSGDFAAACSFNFVLGLGLYGSVYVLPLFLGFVRGRSPLEIGVIMTVTGAAQLIAAPFAAFAERRFAPAFVAGFGFALFAAGALANAHQTPQTDFWGLLVPQALRGAAVLFCILPTTTVALAAQPQDRLANASAVLNLMRNIGGAVGIGLVDTIVNVRPPILAAQLGRSLARGDANTAAFLDLPPRLVASAGAHPSAAAVDFVRPIIERGAAAIAFNEAWLVLGVLTACSLVALPLLRTPTVPE